MGVLSAAQRQHFEEQGYLVVENVLDQERDIAPLMAEYDDVLTDIARALHAQGTLRSTYDDLPFPDRPTQVSQESGRNFAQYFDFSLPQGGIHYDTPIHVGPAVFNVLTCPRLLDVVEDIAGPEIYSNPVQHIRTKLPKRAVAAGKHSALISWTPWHQDNGVVLEEADQATILTVWIAVTDATVENGCMQVIPGSHRGGLAPHCPTEQSLTIPATLMDLDRAKALPMNAGSVLLMHQQTMHSSLDNVTDDQVRISLDVRYQPTGQPTGRPRFPGFVARSAAHPEHVLRDPAAWAKLWYDTRERLADLDLGTFNRWSAEAAVCA